MNENIIICRLCLKTVCDDFQIVTETLRDILDKLLLNVNLDVSRNAVICTECMQKIQVSVNFKSICANARDMMLPSDFNTELNLNTYTIEGTNTLFDISKGHEICFFCKNPTAEGCLLSSNDPKENVFMVELLQKHMPELNLTNIGQLIACRTCLESLQSLLGLITNSLNMEDTIKKYIEVQGTDENGQVELYFVQQFTFKPTLTFDTSYTALNPTEFEYAERDQNTATKVQAVQENVDVDGLELRIEYADIDINSDQNDYESLQTSLFLSECPLKLMFKCERCPFISECLKKLEKHMMSHGNIPEPTMYKCEQCSYENQDKGSLIEHMEVHAMLQCGSCSFSTRDKDSLDRHELTHTEGETFICHKCFFQTNVKKDLGRHMLVHRDLSAITMYKCDTCAFQTKHRNNLKTHNVRSHKTVSEVTKYECESCSFTTKYKRNMERHRATHKAPKLEYTFKVTLYTCEFCPYETRHKHYLKTHMLKHKLPSELTVHQCDVCSYKTTRGKERLRQHMIVHKDASEMIVYGCDSCSFTSKYKNSYERHMLTHKKPSETPMYRCIKFDTCSFQTKHKNNLKAHNMRFHRDALDRIGNGH